jgi:hypothetical protein
MLPHSFLALIAPNPFEETLSGRGQFHETEIKNSINPQLQAAEFLALAGTVRFISGTWPRLAFRQQKAAGIDALRLPGFENGLSMKPTQPRFEDVRPRISRGKSKCAVPATGTKGLLPRSHTSRPYCWRPLLISP